MAIYYCPKCNKRYFLDCNIDESFENDFECEFCGYSKSFTQQSNNNSTTTVQDTNENKFNNEFLKIEHQKISLLKDLHKMMKFFYITSIIGIVLLVFTLLIELGSRI